ncbi:hypothetical protein EQV77_17810 [Halobacillus fulvus]|nr:hypothetical protein EQV77_17810 [Halobacillus fulvus]
MKILKEKLTMIMLIVGISMFVAGCSSTNIQSASKDDNVSSIQTVLQNQFNGPDQKLMNLLEDPENATFIGDTEEEGNNKETETELEKYFSEVYKPFFTENMYEKFIGAYAMNYHTAAAKNNYKIEVKELKISQGDSNKDAYDFSLKVAYEGKGINGSEKVTGKAHMNDEGKITKIQYFENNLLNALETK